MKQESYVAAVIAAADNETQLDRSCKRILAAVDILARILHYSVREYANYTPDEIAEGFIDVTGIQVETEVAPGMTNRSEVAKREQEEDALPNEAKVYFDVKLTVRLPDEYRTKTQIYLCMDVEAQNKYYPGYPLEQRGFYYIARLISSQLQVVSEGPGYAGIQKVYSIWICFGNSIPEKHQQTITRYYINKQDLEGVVETENADYDLMELIIIRLGEKETSNYLLGMLSTLFCRKLSAKERITELEEHYGIPMKRELKEEVNNMSSFGAAIRERAEKEGREAGMAQGIAEGMAQGMAQGMEAGMAEGEQKKLVELICKKLKKGKSLDIIAEELEEEKEAVQSIYDAAAACSPEYDCVKVYEIWRTSQKDSAAEA